MLKLLTIDELQLFVQFGCRFRNEFFALKEKVFAPLSLSGGKQTKIPILFMTATATTTILEQTRYSPGFPSPAATFSGLARRICSNVAVKLNLL